MSYTCGLCAKKGIRREFDDYLDLEIHVLTEHYDDIDWVKVAGEWEKTWFEDLSVLLKRSKDVYDALKTVVGRLADDVSGSTDGAFINACLAVEYWEQMDYYIQQMFEALREDPSFKNVLEKLKRWKEH